MKTNISKKITGVLLITAMLICMSATAFAAEASVSNTEVVLNEVASTSSEVYYGNVWLNPGNYPNQSYFTVSCTLTGTFYATFELEAPGSNNSSATLYVEYPNGNYKYVPIVLNSSGNPVYKMSLSYSGKGNAYKIHYTGYTDKGMRLMCWMYKDRPDDFDDYH